jgi:hypothetical protein
MKILKREVAGIVRVTALAGVLMATACGAQDPAGEGVELNGEDETNLPVIGGMPGESNDDGAYASCWVTLNYCNNSAGNAVCTGTSGCGVFTPTCDRLYRRYCGAKDYTAWACWGQAGRSTTCVSQP